MTMKKGFVKILEAIIASVILLTALTFFLSAEVRQTNWDGVFTQLRAEDVLGALAKSGTVQAAVLNNDPSQLDSVLRNSLEMIPSTFDYSLEIRGVPNPEIFVECFCDVAERTSLEQILAPPDFSYKGRIISIRIDTNADINVIRPETNVLYLPRYVNMAGNENIKNFLERGGTVFLKSDLTRPQVEDRFINDTFGLRWVQGTRGNTGSFDNPDNENRTTFRIAKYFLYTAAVQSGTPPVPPPPPPPGTPIIVPPPVIPPESKDFTFTGLATIERDERTIIFANSLSLVKINKEIGNGRSVWMSEMPFTETNNNLTKAMFTWASGERFKIDTLPKTLPPHHVKAKFVVYDLDPYEAVLTVWKVLR